MNGIPAELQSVHDHAGIPFTFPWNRRSRWPGNLVHAEPAYPYLVAQKMAEDVTGSSFSDFVRERVLQPIGMRSSEYEQPLTPKPGRESAVEHDAQGKPIAGGAQIYPELAPAGLWSTATDLARWAIDLEQAGSGKSHRVLSPSMARQMLTSGLQNWGLGIATGGAPRNRFFTHSGVCVGFRAYLLLHENGDGIVVLGNAPNGLILSTEIVRTVAEGYGWTDFRPAVRTVSTTGSHEAAAFVGQFQLYRYTTLSIGRDGDALYAQRSGQSKIPLQPAGRDRYFSPDFDVDFSFEFGPDTSVRAFNTIQSGQSEHGTLINKARVAAIEDELAHKQKANEPDPQSETLLRKFVKEAREGRLDSSQFSVAMAQIMRERSVEFLELFRNLEDIRKVEFVRVSPDGQDVFDVQFKNGTLRWSILPSADGRIDLIGFKFQLSPVG